MVAADGFLPEAPFDYQAAALEVRVGCNRLRCGRCEAAVKQRVGVALRQGKSIFAQLYASSDWGPFVEEKRIEPMAGARLYHCMCRDALVVSETNLEPEDGFPEPEWSCSGHPPLRLPVKLDGIVLSDGGNFAEVVRSAFAGTLAARHPAVAVWRSDFINRIYAILEGEPAAERVAEAAFGLLDDGDVNVALGAATFFSLHPEPKAAAGLSAYFIANRENLEARKNPNPPGESLRYWFLQAIAARVSKLDPFDGEAVAIARSEILSGATTPPVLRSALRLRDPVWAKEHGVR